MNGRERVAEAMRLSCADRVPLMCQLSAGHYFLQSGLDPVDIWCESEAFAEALVRLQQRYRFDGILVNLPGRDPRWKDQVERIEPSGRERIIRWNSGAETNIPPNDCPSVSVPGQSDLSLERVNPEELFYVEPWGLEKIPYPYAWDFGERPRPGESAFPPYQLDTLRQVLELVGGRVSVHAEVFSPWSQFLELMGFQNALIAVMDDPGKVKACLERLSEGAIELGRLQASLEIDAILVSSAFAGAGFISRAHYQEFVLPFEHRVIAGIGDCKQIPVYTHTCGAIGDRLDLMLETGTQGIDTLDPPPLGTVELPAAKELLCEKAFIKGNIDPVNTLLSGDPARVRADAEYRLGVGMPGGGFILSSACSVAPETPPENLLALAAAVEEFGAY